MEALYQERLKRYTTALRNGKPDRIPIRPFVAEFVGRYSGVSCQELSHDYVQAFDATRKCAADFDWDAVVPNMVYVWTGLTQAIGMKYYGVPGIDVPADTGFQYIEPPEGQAWMRADEYDALIEDPTEFLFNTWLPRVSREVSAPGEKNTYRNNLSFLKGGMAMLSYFNAFPEQASKLRTESGTPCAIAGILKAPLDIIADKMRGYLGLLEDLETRPEKVLAACEALMPHLTHVALSTADPDRQLPIAFWMHRSCVPFIRQAQFDKFSWPTLKPVIEELWLHGHQTLFYAEGNWDFHLDAFSELPDQSIVYHVDQGDIFNVHKKIGQKFCLSGGVPNALLGYGTEDNVRQCCKKIIDEVAMDGGYIMDASAIIQNDAKVENMRAMTDFTREFGVYDSTAPSPKVPEPDVRGLAACERTVKTAPGLCIPWEEQRKTLPDVLSGEDLLKQVWEDNEALAYTYIWQCLLSF
jgi:uroporphyrinogen-III decarboxylase